MTRPNQAKRGIADGFEVRGMLRLRRFLVLCRPIRSSLTLAEKLESSFHVLVESLSFALEPCYRSEDRSSTFGVDDL